VRDIEPVNEIELKIPAKAQFPLSPEELEIKDAQLIFQSVWSDLEKILGRENLRFPKELIWLGGAPGSGKGINTPFILKERGITAEPIVISSLLDSPEAKRVKDAGGMVRDTEAVAVLLRKLLEPRYESGALIDGFPRTKVQVECLKHLYEKMIELRAEFLNTPSGGNFRQPIFRVILLFVDKRISIERQLKRGLEVKEHNQRVREGGSGVLLEERATDYSENLARNRYRVFKEKTYGALQSLREQFHYHFIDASGSIPEVESNIFRELKYQSTLELDQETFDRIRGIPLADSIVLHARQEMVKRLDSYTHQHPEIFKKIIRLIEEKIMPVVLRHAISGEAQVNLENEVLENSVARSMLIDVFSERGYHAIFDINEFEVPSAIDPKSHKIHCIKKIKYRIQIKFKGWEIRRNL